MIDLETAALNGTLFNSHRSPSPARSTSPSPSNTDHDLGSDLQDGTTLGGPSYDAVTSSGPQTGPKGVISDRKAHSRGTRRERDLALRGALGEQERRKMVGLMLDEEDQMRDEEGARLIRRQESDEGRVKHQDEEEFREHWRTSRMTELQGSRIMKRGFREIGQEGFLSAVERPGWVIVLIYEPVRLVPPTREFRGTEAGMSQGIPRCSALLASMLQLSLSDPPPSITIYRARATSLSFSLLPSQGGGDRDEAEADPDVLPTLLAYKDGELEKTWIRVDWEVKEDGIEGLLGR